jgi:hypothetical protein
MTALVHIEPGQWVLTYVEHFYPGYRDGNMPRALEHLVEGGSGWDCLYHGREQFLIVQADRVMPKTFRSSDGKRHDRSLVVAAAGTVNGGRIPGHCGGVKAGQSARGRPLAKRAFQLAP